MRPRRAHRSSVQRTAPAPEAKRQRPARPLGAGAARPALLGRAGVGKGLMTAHRPLQRTRCTAVHIVQYPTIALRSDDDIMIRRS